MSTAHNNNGKFASTPQNARAGAAAAANNRWSPPAQTARSSANPAAAAAPRLPPQAAPPVICRPPPSLAAIELFQKAQALLLALPAQPPVLRREGVELIAALGTGYLNGDAASLIAALKETRKRCGRLLALLTALCPAQLAEFEMPLHGLHRACGYFIRYLLEQKKLKNEKI